MTTSNVISGLRHLDAVWSFRSPTFHIGLPRLNPFRIFQTQAFAPEPKLAFRRIKKKFGKSVRESFEAQTAMFPNMMSDAIYKVLNKYKNQASGWKLSGAGGGGYLIFVSETPIKNAIQIRIRRGE